VRVTEFADPSLFVALPRLTTLTLAPDGRHLVTAVQAPDRKGARYASALWTIPLDGGEPVRLTRSAKGEVAPAFRPDGTLLFASTRPDPEGDEGEEDDAALWLLPPAGEPRLLARTPGGVSGPVVATASGTTVVLGRRFMASIDAEDDAARRKTRKDRKINAILHTGMPIRYWDAELGADSPRLLVLNEDGTVRDLTPDAGLALTTADYSITADGATVATTWRRRERGGAFPYEVHLIDVASGERRPLAADPGVSHQAPRISPDGRLVALLSETDGSYDEPFTWALRIVPVDGGVGVEVQIGDLYPTEWAWSADGGTLYVTGDWHGRGAVLAVDPSTGAVHHRLAADAAYSQLNPAPDGTALYALRSTVGAAPHPVRLDPAGTDQEPVALPTPAPTPPLPGRLEEVSVEVAGGTVRGWLCRPSGNDPAPVMTWIHGGPFVSANSWSWRWNPWVCVAAGWAVLMPDPALSTGYGPEWIARAWPHRAALVWRDVEALLDAVLTRPDLDASRTACLGGSFGGFMTNWVAGHTDRFGAIVTHAGLWALEQQHDTTDAAHWKNTWFGEPDEHPEWYAENSPERFADRIITPMLVIHGNRDYRVPISEALRLWWDLVKRWDGPPEQLPHRFLNLTGENHWVLSPANAEIWYDTVLGFCGQHVLDQKWEPSELLP